MPPERERLQLAPLDINGDEVLVSFTLPSGYTVVNSSDGLVEFEGPIVQYGPEPKPDNYWVRFLLFESSGGPREAAHTWCEEQQISRARESGCGDVAFPVEKTFRLDGLEAYLLHVGFRCSERAEPGYDYLWATVAVTMGEDLFLIFEVGHPLLAYETFAPFEPLVVGGRPYPDVREAILDTILGSLTVSIEQVGAPEPEFVASVPGPDEISTDPEVIGTNMFLALFVILAFAFTSTLFNQTLEENRRQIEGWVGRFFTPFRRITSLVEQRYGVVAARQPWVRRFVGPAVILVLTGLIYGFLSPDFGFNTKSVVLFVSMLIGVGAITYVYKGGQALFTTRRLRTRAGVKLYGVALVIAAGCVLLSRLVDFQPGFLYGSVAAYTLLAPAALDRRQSGQTVFFPAVALLALSVIAWLLVIPLREVTQGSDAWWVALPEGAAAAVFVAGLEGLFFNMIPLSFMDGAKIAQWNRLLWFLMFGVAGFLFWHVLLNQEGVYLHALPERKVVAALGLLAFYSIVTLGTWAYFRQRVYGWALPSVATVWGTVAGWARGVRR